MLVGNNLRSLEISEGKASEREDTYQVKLNELSEKFQQVIISGSSGFHGKGVGSHAHTSVQACNFLGV